MSRLRTAVVIGAVAVALAPSPPPAGAAEPATVREVGWWTRRPGATATPPGGFEVAESPDDDLSVAALRVQTDASLTSAQLVLREASGVRQDAASLRVCVTTSSWSPANPGPYAQRPAATCGGGGIALTRAAAGGSWSADVLPLMPARAGTVSLMIVPGPAASGLPVDGFQAVFAGAEVDAVAADEDDEDDGSSTGGGPVTSFGTGTTTSESFGFGFGGNVDTPVTVPTDTATTTPVDSEADDGEQVAGLPIRPAGSGSGEPGKPWIRMPALILVAAGVGAAAAAARRQLRERGVLAD